MKNTEDGYWVKRISDMVRKGEGGARPQTKSGWDWNASDTRVYRHLILRSVGEIMYLAANK